MAIKVGNTYVSETAYAQAKARIANEQNGEKSAENSELRSIRRKMPGWEVSANTQPYNGGGLKNIAIDPAILRKMANDPEKRLEYEALLIDIKNTSLSDHLPKGMEMVAQGFIIDANGGLSAWCITRTEADKPVETNSMLPSDKKEDWTEILLERLSEGKEKAYEKADGIYYKV